MKKRLRKKFRTGEYTEYGFKVAFRMAAPFEQPAVEAMLDAFLDQIESQGLAGGGSGGPNGDFSFFVAAYRPRLVVTEAHRQALEAWLGANPAVTGPSVGPLIDARHSEFMN